jgi:hypothetical protein
MASTNLTAHAVTLYHRLIWARALAQNYRRALARDGEFLHQALQSGLIGSYDECFRTDMYMCLWFSTLYIVVEGWPGLRQSDPSITRLLRSPNKRLLKDFRDATLHPNHWSDTRFQALVDKGDASFTWAQELTDAFWQFFAPVIAIDRRHRRRPRGKRRLPTA